MSLTAHEQARLALYSPGYTTGLEELKDAAMGYHRFIGTIYDIEIVMRIGTRQNTSRWPNLLTWEGVVINEEEEYINRFRALTDQYSAINKLLDYLNKKSDRNCYERLLCFMGNVVEYAKRQNIVYKKLEPFRVAGAWLCRHKGLDMNGMTILVNVGLGAELREEMAALNPDHEESDDEDQTVDASMGDLSESRRELYIATFRSLKESHPFITYGFRAARKTDTNKAKSLIGLVPGNPQIAWDDREVTPYLDSKDKKFRGISHPSISPLLCSHKYIARFKDEDANVRAIAHTAVQSVPFKETNMLGLLYGYSMYEEGKYYAGYLRGYLLTKLWKALAPKSSDDADGGEARVKAVTIEGIAYIACQAVFMLLPKDNWSSNIEGFDMFGFYRNIIMVFQRGAKTWQEDLLRWWNKQVLGSPDPINEVPEEDSDLAMALAEGSAQAAADPASTP
ncbi:hypothetical protein MPER_13161 [Moniliophthora perniciosa FA553]|nr:hypothetical protein MPER_13161 [Moniliophthora perniciosa FA553]